MLVCDSLLLHCHNTLASVCRQSCVQVAKLVRQCLAQASSMTTRQQNAWCSCVAVQLPEKVAVDGVHVSFPTNRIKQLGFQTKIQLVC